MVESTRRSRVPFLVLRFMRRPLMLLVAVYSVSMVGWVLIPGPVIDGVQQEMSLFHAFYFLTYTATTTGFGEILYPFTDAQRMWSIASLYAGVVAWLYAIGAIIHLVQNPHFRHAVAERRFTTKIARLTEPFVMVCGFGNTGSLLTRGLSDNGITAVILDLDPDRVMALYLRDYRVAMHALCADARVPQHLIEAGLMQPNCRAVVALTGDEEGNLKIATTARLLNESLRVIVKSTSEEYEQTLSTLGADVHIVDPFHTYSRYLRATIRNPLIHMFNAWLVGVPRANLAMYPEIPHDRWILCGYGRMGRSIHAALASAGIEVTVIDPDIAAGDVEGGTFICGRGSQEQLRAAGIESAAGIVVGTNRDPENLGIVLNARTLNPKIFILVRQNRHRNEVVFSAAQADLIMQPSLVTARRMLFVLIAPLLRDFYDHVRVFDIDSNEAFLESVIGELRNRLGETKPRVWTTRVDKKSSAALTRYLEDGRPVALGDITRDPSNREAQLACVPLVVRSAGNVSVMPRADRAVYPGDEILFCGSSRGYAALDATLNNDYTLTYVVTGVEETRSIVLRWLFRRSESQVSAT